MTAYIWALIEQSLLAATYIYCEYHRVRTDAYRTIELFLY